MYVALEMKSRQAELERVEGRLEKRSQDIGELQARLQDAEKLLVRPNPFPQPPTNLLYTYFCY